MTHVDGQESIAPSLPARAGTAGPRATSALVIHESWAVALEHATDRILSPGEPPPDVLLLFASQAYGSSFAQMVRAAQQRTNAVSLLGCSVSGFLAEGIEVEDQPGLSLMALWLPGATIHHLRLHQEHIELLDDPALWHDIHPIAPADVNAWLIFAEPFRIDVQAILTGMQRLYPGAAIMGGIASGMVDDRKSCVFFDGQFYDEGAVALGIGGPYSLHPRVSQGCEPIGESWTITEVERNLVITISNRPAVEVLQETVTRLPRDQREHAQNNLVVGLAVDEYHDRFERGDFVVRGILGIDPRRGSIAVGGLPRVGQTLQFQLRDAGSADADLGRILGNTGTLSDTGIPVAAILCTCDGRGEALFGVPNHDAVAVKSALGGVPLVGGFFLGEIGPLGDQAVLHGFTATFGVIRYNPPFANG